MFLLLQGRVLATSADKRKGHSETMTVSSLWQRHYSTHARQRFLSDRSLSWGSSSSSRWSRSTPHPLTGRPTATRKPGRRVSIDAQLDKSQDDCECHGQCQDLWPLRTADGHRYQLPDSSVLEWSSPPAVLPCPQALTAAPTSVSTNAKAFREALTQCPPGRHPYGLAFSAFPTTL